MHSKADYIGRFAPSPSGPLHFGSLVTAVASFLDARNHAGAWLLRMEDLDPAREPPGAADAILRTLEEFGLTWDGPVLYQSDRLGAYAAALEILLSRELVFVCDCSRQQILGAGGVYDGRCRVRAKPPSRGALRVKVPDTVICFDDPIQGHIEQHLQQDCGDFIVVRKDGLFAYQLAVVVDDAYQGITDVVRGSDLLDSTPRQIFLQNALDLHTPRYAHIPVAVNESGQKLSKQHFAKPLNSTNAAAELYTALQFLGQFLEQSPEPGLSKATVHELLDWATAHWDIQAVPKLANIRLDQPV